MDDEIDDEVALDAAIACDYNRKVGFDHCPLCEMGWPRNPSSVAPGKYVHNAVGGRRRVGCSSEVP